MNNRLFQLITLLLFCTIFGIKTSEGQTLISYEKLFSYDIAQTDSFFNAKGVPPFITAKNGVDFYKITYWAPYKHIDSLVEVSAAVAFPVKPDCAFPITGYMHGTVSNKENVPSRLNTESQIGVILASDGYVAAMPDYLGLGDSDAPIHPYVHGFSQGHTSVFCFKATRELADSLGIALNGQLFLTGYSQGGFSTVATHKLIEESFSNEFQVTASAPMSGPYDLKVAQVDQIASDSAYATPGYLPYILLGYHSVEDSLAQFFPDITAVFKSPYDTLIPPLFYEKTNGIGFINNLCTPVPKEMIKDTFVADFLADSLHPLRVALAKSHLLEWTPQAPIKIHYCSGDEQVTYLNAIRAYDSWTARGATDITIEDFGNLIHIDCVAPSVLSAKGFMDSYKQGCDAIGIEAADVLGSLRVYPNPTQQGLNIILPEGISEGSLSLLDVAGKQILSQHLTTSSTTIDISTYPDGLYVLQLATQEGTFRGKVLKN